MSELHSGGAIPIVTVPYAFARKFGVVLLEPDGERFRVALREGSDPRALAERRYGYVREQQLLQRPDQEPTIDELVREYMGAEPPVPPADLPGSTPPPLPAPKVITPEVHRSTTTIQPVPPPRERKK